MLAYHFYYARNFVRTKAPALCDLQTIQPYFYGRFTSVDMNMRRLIRLVAIKVKAVAIQSEDCWLSNLQYNLPDMVAAFHMRVRGGGLG